MPARLRFREYRPDRERYGHPIRVKDIGQVNSARTCGGELPTSMERVKSSRALWSCGRARMPWM